MAKKSSSASSPVFDSAHDQRSGRGLRMLAVVLALALLVIAGTSATGGETIRTPRDAEAGSGQDGDAATKYGKSRGADAEVASALEGRLAQLGDSPAEKTARRFYAERDHRLAWIDRSGIPREDSLALVEVLQGAGEQGLYAADYQADELKKRLQRSIRGTQKMAVDEMDVDLTVAFLRYAGDLLHGRLLPDHVSEAWHLEPRQRDLVTLLEETLSQPEGVLRTAERLDPDHPGYERLKDAYTRYGRLAAAGGWPLVPNGEIIKPGDTMKPNRFRALVERLRVEGFLPSEVAQAQLDRMKRNRQAAAEASTKEGGTEEGGTEEGAPDSHALTFRGDLESALIRFQDAHGILEDGALGPNTLAELNVTAEERLRLIGLNLERWRWLPDSLGERYIMVNLPGFELTAIDSGRVTRKMHVVVGKEGWETPIINERMEHVVVNPYWNIPASILHDEILPALRENPGYLAAKNMEVVSTDSGEVVNVGAAALANGNYRVRQRPGGSNALGTIKFIFPNRFNVYLHDTPADAAFDRTNRGLSHGCVRVEDPIGLADWVFRDSSEWSGEKVQRQIRSKEQETIVLDEQIPVYFLYWTAFVTEDGEVHFRPDLYGYDEKHTEALEGLGRAA